MTSLMYRRLSRLPNYLQAFGGLSALRLDFAIERALPQRSDRIRSFDVPGCTGPVWLRDCISDHAIFWQCLVRRQYSLSEFPHTRNLMLRYEQLLSIGQKPLIIDAGGNIGLSAIALAEAFPGATILVVEPDEQNFAVLQRNIAPYGQRIAAVLGAVWPDDQDLAIVNRDAGASAFRVDASGPTGTVKAYTIDTLMRMANCNEILLAKIDIEGGQKALFAANTEWISHTDVIMLELDDWLMPWQGTSLPFVQAMSKHCFEYLLNGENLVCFNSRLAEASSQST